MILLMLKLDQNTTMFRDIQLLLRQKCASIRECYINYSTNDLPN